MEIFLAIVGGFLLAEALRWIRRIVGRETRKHLDAVNEKLEQEMQRLSHEGHAAHEALYGHSPRLVVTTVDGGLKVVYETPLCAGPHAAWMSPEASESQTHFLTYLNRQINERRFAELVLVR